MSSSASASNTSTKNRDGRVAGDNGAIGVSAEGNVGINIVADEAFDLGMDAINGIVRANADLLDASGDNAEVLADGLSYALAETADFAHAALETVANTSRDSNDAVSGALFAVQQSAKSEAGQIGEQLIKVAVPAAALAFVAAAILK